MKNPVSDDPKKADGERRVLRGGHWYTTPNFLLSAYRSGNSPSSRRFNYGFRVVRNKPKGKK
tara:strand:- start:961 stop:1146 length:186 start_codon:yes stop_codon:yes gene_type:complete